MCKKSALSSLVGFRTITSSSILPGAPPPHTSCCLNHYLTHYHARAVVRSTVLRVECCVLTCVWSVISDRHHQRSIIITHQCHLSPSVCVCV